MIGHDLALAPENPERWQVPFIAFVQHESSPRRAPRFGRSLTTATLTNCHSALWFRIHPVRMKPTRSVGRSRHEHPKTGPPDSVRRACRLGTLQVGRTYANSLLSRCLPQALESVRSGSIGRLFHCVFKLHSSVGLHQLAESNGAGAARCTRFPPHPNG